MTKITTNIKDYDILKGILPKNSADMVIVIKCHYNDGKPDFEKEYTITDTKKSYRKNRDYYGVHYAIPAWSLSKLLELLPKEINGNALNIEEEGGKWYIWYGIKLYGYSKDFINAVVKTFKEIYI
jgi:hypothetical protein